MSLFHFFFQAEDGIRDGHVTGVQTCALPIYQPFPGPFRNRKRLNAVKFVRHSRDTSELSRPWDPPSNDRSLFRSEERRVGKECRSGGWPDREREKRHSTGCTRGKTHYN